jgi:hypothetical protein
MPGKPSEPTPPGQARAGTSGDAPGASPERTGPMAIERMTKPDGRALIVYQRQDMRP